MDGENNNQFKLPEDGGLAKEQPEGPNVDNFSPPENEPHGSESSFKMPSSSSEPANAFDENEEVEDVFAKPEEKPTAPVSSQAAVKPESVKPEPSKPEPPKKEQKIEMPQEHKGSGCLWGILIFLIIAILAELIAINELGIFNFGLEKYYGTIYLEKLWGGLPKDGKSALADSAQKMKGKNFNLAGSSNYSLEVSGSEENGLLSPEASSNSSPASEINQIIKNGLDFEGEAEINAAYKSPGILDINLSTNASDLTENLSNILANEPEVSLEILSDNGNIYLKNSNLNSIFSIKNDWLKIILNNQESATASSASSLSAIINSGERTGSAKINNVSCYVYQLKINSSAFESYLETTIPNFAWVAKNIFFQSATIYLGKRDHLMYKIELNFSNNLETATIKNNLNLNFYNFGQPLEIRAPEDSSEMIFSDIKNTFLSSVTPTPTTANTPAERDAIRKSDLKKIQDALMAYKIENGKYPSTNGVIEKTRDATSNLKTALVPKYLTVLPLDPENDRYYYGYKSDNGSTCELTAVLEVKSDPDGESIGNYWIYILRGN